MDQTAVLVDAIRTPMAKYGGALSTVRPDDMVAELLKSIMERNPKVDVNTIADIIIGCANQAGEDSRNVARMAAIIAGLPFEIPGQTVNRLCGSSMQAIITAVTTIQSGWGDVFLAGGVESMSRGPYVMPKPDKAFPFGSLPTYDTSLGWRFPNPKIEARVRPLNMGETAEEIYAKYKIPREEQDRYAVQSHRRAIAAWKNGVFSDYVIPVPIQTKGGVTMVDRDEGPRADSSLESLSKLRPAFRKDGTVTAGNSCPMSDGASMTLLMSENKAHELGYTSWFRLRSAAVSGLHPDIMGLGPVEATRKALALSNLSLKDLGLIEINEAFAVQALACIRELEFDETRVNVNGGAIALGHPLGCSGARIVGTLAHEMRKRDIRFGLAAMCIGVGQGIATVWEKVGK
ncbi:thiolase family protein [bacterium]|nr:MAG: thiolase family protein [bacterium]